MNPPCPRHGDTMNYRVTTDDFMCKECGFTLESQHVVLETPAPEAPETDA